MRRNNWTVGMASTRPAGELDECFYCKNKIGKPHKMGCVIKSKTVIVRYSIEVMVDVPMDWEKDNIEFQRGESSWCADSIIIELENHSKDMGCICEITKCKYVREATKEDEEFYRRSVEDIEC